MTPTLSPRAARILAALVAEYIETAEPVGSARLAHRAGLGVSSATVRNTLAELEELAAGRAASAELRFHVDACADCRRRSDEIAADNQMVARLGELVAAERDPPAAPPAAPPALPEVDGYRVTAELHRGGQGIVYEGVQLSTRRKVALKVLLDGALANETQVARFDREIESVLKLRHVNVVALLDQGRARDGRLFFAMEFVERVALDEFAQARRVAG